MQKSCKILKALSGVLLATAVVSSTCFADAPVAKLENNTISLSYSHEDYGYGTMVYILNTRVGNDDIISEEYLRENLVWVGRVSGGNAECVLPEGSPYGVYTVMVGADGLSDIKSSRLVYILNEEPGITEEAQAAANSAATPDELFDVLELYNDKAYMIDMDGAQENKVMIYELVKALPEDATIDDIAACVAKAGEFGAMKNYSESEIAEALVNNKDALGLDADIIEYGEAVAAIVAERIAYCENVSDIKTLCEEALALVALNEAASSEFFDIVEKYNNIFNVTISDKLDKVSDYEIKKILSNYNFTDVSMVEEIINDAIYELYEESRSSGSGSSGGGGRGGSVSSAPTTLIQPEVDRINDNVITKNDLNDLAGYEWAADAINYLYAKGIISGDGNGIFRPGDKITREEFTKILISAFNEGKTVEKTVKFTDVSDEWYKPYVETAFSLGIVNGMSEDVFGVGVNLTRQDAAVMIKRAADATYKDITKKKTLVGFADKDDIDDYAKIAVDVLARAEIINGYNDGTFRPQNLITRAEIAMVIYNCMAQ